MRGTTICVVGDREKCGDCDFPHVVQTIADDFVEISHPFSSVIFCFGSCKFFPPHFRFIRALDHWVRVHEPSRKMSKAKIRQRLGGDWYDSYQAPWVRQVLARNLNMRDPLWLRESPELVCAKWFNKFSDKIQRNLPLTSVFHIFCFFVPSCLAMTVLGAVGELTFVLRTQLHEIVLHIDEKKTQNNNQKNNNKKVTTAERAKNEKTTKFGRVSAAEHWQQIQCVFSR